MVDISALPPVWFQLIVVSFLGLVLGSFASALAYRAPRALGWGLFSRTRSSCPACGRVLGAAELVPLVSWALQRGKCRGCGGRISAAYPLIELFCLTMAWAVWLGYGFSVSGIVVLLAAPFLAALLATDFEHMILPDSLIAALWALGGLYHGLYWWGGVEAFSDTLGFLLSGLAYSALFWALGWGMGRLTKREALGPGDIKFVGAAGFWLGGGALPVFCFMAGVGGVALGLFWRIILKKDVFPFGPALILAFYGLLLLRGRSGF